MITSPLGKSIIKTHEGYSSKAYLCPARVWTIGYGTTTYPNGQKVKEGDTCTREQAEAYLSHHLKQFEAAILGAVRVPLTQNQFDSLVSLVYNIGPAAFSTSTLLKKLNTRDYQGTAEEFPRWNKSNGKVLQGLVRRREEERKLFLEGIKKV